MDAGVKRGLREIVAPSEKAVIPALLAAWGYVRSIEAAELQLGIWFAYGDDGLFWLLRDGAWEADDEAQVHLCAAPGARGRIASRWAVTAIEVAAALCGVRVLHAPAREEWEGLLGRLGWTKLADPRAPETAAGRGWLVKDLGARPAHWTRASVLCEAREPEHAREAERVLARLTEGETAREDARPWETKRGESRPPEPGAGAPG